jgi:hypothetical protein
MTLTTTATNSDSYATAARLARGYVGRYGIESIELKVTSTGPAATRWFDDHRATYETIYDRLYRTNMVFWGGSDADRMEMLQKSYVFAVYSINTTVERHEPAYVETVEHYEETGAWPDRDGLARIMHENSVLYHNNKARLMDRALSDATLWADLLWTLTEQGLDAAHQFALDRVPYIATAKAPFLFAMLGFTDKMCLDTNVLQATGIRGNPDIKDAATYDDLTGFVLRLYDSLSSFLTPFMVQWVVFDMNRGNVSEHLPFFGSLGIA